MVLFVIQTGFSGAFAIRSLIQYQCINSCTELRASLTCDNLTAEIGSLRNNNYEVDASLSVQHIAEKGNYAGHHRLDELRYIFRTATPPPGSSIPIAPDR
ncbi:hypothetical protein KP509_14G086400 [Ceratopteris richardii]|nr:hypothetical protein KP509_14G086400 [Ceratopteris richardii]